MDIGEKTKQILNSMRDQLAEANAKLLQFVYTHKFGYTLGFGTIGSLIMETAKLTPFYESEGISPTMVLLPGFLSADIVKNIMVSRESKKLEKEIETIQSVDVDYFNEIVNKLKKDYGIKGELISAKEDPLGQQGTGILKKGYINRISLEFENGQEIKLLHKYNDKGNTQIGEIVTDALIKKGFEFIPKRYSVKTITELDHFFPGERKKPNRGTFYEYIDGESLEETLIGEGKPTPLVREQINIENVNQLFDNLFKVYNETDLLFNPFRSENDFQKILPHFSKKGVNMKMKVPKINEEFIERWIKSKKGDEETKNLVARLEESYESLNFIPKTIIHGDLHQGNVLVNGDNTHIIDWDSAQIGIPYQDFMLFSVVSDFEKHPEYEATKNRFIERQSEISPGFTEKHQKMIEFETYTSALKRYYRAVQKKEIINEYKQNMLQSCKYLLEKSKETLREYSQLVENDELEKAFKLYAEKKFNKKGAKLDNIEYNSMASISYAHTINHTQQKKQKGSIKEVVEENIKSHINQAKEERTKRSNRQFSYRYGLPTAYMGAIIGSIASIAYTYDINAIDLFNKIASTQGISIGISTALVGIMGTYLHKNETTYSLKDPVPSNFREQLELKKDIITGKFRQYTN